jgi:hypothetical protein
LKDFKFIGDLFVVETGSFVPVTGASEFEGYTVVRVNVKKQKVKRFIEHKKKTVEVIFDPEGFNKPIDLKFRENQMYIVDLGVFEPGVNLPQPGTGKVWIVSRRKEK